MNESASGRSDSTEILRGKHKTVSEWSFYCIGLQASTHSGYGSNYCLPSSSLTTRVIL